MFDFNPKINTKFDFKPKIHTKFDFKPKIHTKKSSSKVNHWCLKSHSFSPIFTGNERGARRTGRCINIFLNYSIYPVLIMVEGRLVDGRDDMDLAASGPDPNWTHGSGHTTFYTYRGKRRFRGSHIHRTPTSQLSGYTDAIVWLNRRNCPTNWHNCLTKLTQLSC